ncbi:Maltose permease [Komagataella phaffii CBS 7435]|uniref:Maltose permease, high-affinity maltose transporter (Alpha-glucoside transporter) n=2 Tax=Komagataella phaffii TaxID=460519 RepID=C4R6L5_KOMPG|nr:Maltose permease, high-affinity maltose transporter (alpha-glucoside transporter) [Komagataella phaffii GS115]AOA64408.1 GQ67_04319T0 [Komagataella phaffii]CAH2451423.1 Maltose permease [Komagataella phaffii CBS 7435]AOA70054.1 GQ68_04291T0 [Komagataella phaffii GS115]CAY71240.1 Maltose permease, high-affinity maltose transporter (alpha-glucoside transporter) [Komagataella phaffii GS115]CCA41155.1 Maltose permease [Komagataella phaffii CBS 7435]
MSSITSKQTAEEKELQSVAKTVTAYEFSELEKLARAQQEVEHGLSKWEAIKTYPKAFFWICAGIFIAILVGYESQAGGIVLSIPRFREDFGNAYQGGYVLPADWQSAITGGATGALVVGSFFGSFTTDKWGRKWVIMFALLLSIPSVILEFVATTIEVFFAGKFINAFCLGILLTVVTAYIAEISPLALRGVAIASINLALCVGPFLCYIITYKTQNKVGRMAYRSMMIPQFIIAGISIVWCLFLPESPYYLLTKDKTEKTLKSLNKIYKGSDLVEAQYALMKVTIQEAQLANGEGSSLQELFYKRNFKRTLAGVCSFLIQPLSGVAFISGYSTYYYQLAGFTDDRSFQLSCGAQGLSIFGTITSWFTLDFFGRRSLMIIGTTCMAVLNLLVACLGLNINNIPAVTASCAFMAMYNFFYNASIGPGAYVVSGEVPTNNLRSKTIATGSFLNNGIQCMWSFVLPYMFNPDQANMGSKVLFIFGGLSALYLLVFFFYLPETAGRSFEEIDEMFNDKIPIRKFKGHKCRVQIEAAQVFNEVKGEINHIERV